MNDTSTSQQLSLNSAYLFVSKFLVLALSLISLSATTRYLGPELYGLLTTIVIFVNFFGSFTDFGVNGTVIKLSRGDDKEIVHYIDYVLGLSLSYGLPLVMLVTLLGSLIYRSQLTPVFISGLVFLSLSLFLNSISSSYLPIFQHKLKLGYIALADVASKLMFVGTLLLIVKFNLSIVAIFALNGLVPVVNMAIIYLASKKIAAIKPRFNKKIWLDIIKKALPLGLSIIMLTIYLRVDTFMLTLLSTTEQVGLYGVAYKFIEVGLSIPAIIMGTSFAIMASTLVKERKKFAGQIARLQHVLLAIAFPLAFGGVILAQKLIIYISGEAYVAATPALQVLFAFFIPTFLVYVAINSLIILDRQKSVLKINAIMLVLNVCINFVAIRLFGIVGAAIATLISEVLLLSWLTIILEREVRVPFALRRTVGLLVSAVVMSAIVFMLRDHFFVAIAAGVGVYSFLVLITKSIRLKDFGITKESNGKLT